jgi:prephenate dehydratase
MSIAIQGGKASFHDVAAVNYFGGERETIYCTTFRDVCRSLVTNAAAYGVMAIENSIAGSILGNYKLIKEYKLQIIGEIQLHIQQNLIVLPGVRWSEIQIVKSHPVALLQCEEFFLANPSFKQEEYHDTAETVRYIKENNLRNYAAIAGKYAAQYYGMEIPAGGEGIETEKQNFTRFFILSKDKKTKIEGAEKATLSFQLPDKVGSLASLLKIIVDNQINLTKIQSIPIMGRPHEYNFYVDCEWSRYEDFRKSLDVRSLVTELTILGEYKKGKVIYDHSEGG